MCIRDRSTIGGYAVQVIGARAFQGNTVLESMELPDGLTTIYAYAFADCTNLSLIHISVLGLLAAMYGPVAGGLIGFIGHTLIDLSWGCLLYTSRCV